MRAFRIPAVVIAGVVAATSLGACSAVPSSITAQVPTAGPIEQGEQVGVERQDQFIRVIARGPREGMSPTQVVQGFLDASASFDGDHAVARQFLTLPASADWETDAGVTVYGSVPSLAEIGQTVVMTSDQVGEIATNGRYSVDPPGTSLREEFRLVKVDGEWRIDELPQGLLLSQSDVDRAFRSFAVYFFNPGFSSLVPDPRMVPVIGPGLATTLIRHLIAGPSEWLQPAVRTGLPAGVRLNIDSVPIEGGVAQVDLTANARLADDKTRQAFSQQIVWTLRQLPDVQAIEISAGGLPLSVPGAPSPQPRDAWPAVDPNSLPAGSAGYASRPDGVVRLIPDGVRPVPGAAGTGETPLVDIAISNDSQSVAGVDAQGAVWRGRLIEGAPLIKIREPGRPSALAFDGDETVWLVDADAGLVVVSADGSEQPVVVSGLGRRASLIAAVPSRDGTRAALVVRRGARTQLLLGRIVRAAVGTARLAVTAPIKVESTLVEVVDAAWSSADTISVLGGQSAGSLQIFDIDLASGAATALGSPQAPVTVASAPGLPTLVAAADGLVYENTAGAWQERLRGSSPTYPG